MKMEDDKSIPACEHEAEWQYSCPGKGQHGWGAAN